MNTVTISKEKLLAQLEQNKVEHKIIYDDALHGWQTEVIVALRSALNKAVAGEEYITDLDIDPPENHLNEYDEIIDRVKWHEEDMIVLDLREFNQFVRDSWDWMPHFLNNAFNYSSSTSSSSGSTSSASSLIETKMRNLG
jgi:hypothetical protein